MIPDKHLCQLQFRAYQLAGDPLRLIGTRFDTTGTKIHRVLQDPLSPSPLVLPYYPEVHALAGNLAVVVADPTQWHVEAIQARFNVTHAQAVKWFLDQREHLRLMGYRMLLLWKDELGSPALASMLRYRLKIETKKIGARACTIAEVPQDVARAFYDAHHLQGGCSSKLHLGLIHEGSPVALMSFNRPDTCRGTAEGWLLQRFASSAVVPGGASRLLAEFQKRNPGSPVLSYSDERYAPGGQIYATLGFRRVEGRVAPDYRYWRTDRWYAKNTKQRKHLIAELGGTCTLEDTEYTMASRLRYLRCFDLGKVTWIHGDEAIAAPEGSPTITTESEEN